MLSAGVVCTPCSILKPFSFQQLRSTLKLFVGDSGSAGGLVEALHVESSAWDTLTHFHNYSFYKRHRSSSKQSPVKSIQNWHCNRCKHTMSSKTNKHGHIILQVFTEKKSLEGNDLTAITQPPHLYLTSILISNDAALMHCGSRKHFLIQRNWPEDLT